MAEKIKLANGSVLVPIEEIKELWDIYSKNKNVYYSDGIEVKNVGEITLSLFCRNDYYRKEKPPKIPRFKYAGMYVMNQDDHIWQIAIIDNKYYIKQISRSESFIDEKISSGEWQVYTAEQLRGE